VKQSVKPLMPSKATMVDKSPKKTPPIWEGVYQTWQEAAEVGKGFSSQRWLKRVVQQLDDYHKDRKLHGNMALPPRPCSLPMLCDLTNLDSIVDFGGSSGWVWYYMKECIPNLSIKKYDIIENDEICQFFTNSNYHVDHPISYSTYQNFAGNCDILYTNSTLQYIKDDEIFFRLIEKTNPKYLLVEDLLGGDFDDYFSTQIYYDERIPVKFRNKKNFINNIRDLSFELLSSKDYITSIRGEIQPLPMSNLPEKNRVKYGKTLLFKGVN
jgi:putative methyltransferase (TIGR04325 family)